MTEVDLWADEPIVTPKPENQLVETSTKTIPTTIEKVEVSTVMPEVKGKQIVVTIHEDLIYLFTQQNLETGDFLNLINFTKVQEENNTKQYTARFSAINAFVLRKALIGYKSIINPADGKKLALSR